MSKRIIKIDEAKCDGCGLCVNACHEGAIAMVGGKAKLVREDYCDGLGDCLPACPQDAISMDESDVETLNPGGTEHGGLKFGGKILDAMERAGIVHKQPVMEPAPIMKQKSELFNWPIQIKLAPVWAPCFEEANLLVAADCTAFSYASFHQDFLKGKTTLIGCPKLDAIDYSEKLTEIFIKNEIKSVVVVRMEVPCCTGIDNAVRKAIAASGKIIPCETVIIRMGGTIK